MFHLVMAGLMLTVAILLIATLVRQILDEDAFWEMVVTAALTAAMFIFTFYYIGEYYNWKQ